MEAFSYWPALGPSVGGSRHRDTTTPSTSYKSASFFFFLDVHFIHMPGRSSCSSQSLGTMLLLEEKEEEEKEQEEEEEGRNRDSTCSDIDWHR